jgi:hypothetical protein
MRVSCLVATKRSDDLDFDSPGGNVSATAAGSTFAASTSAAYKNTRRGSGLPEGSTALRKSTWGFAGVAVAPFGRVQLLSSVVGLK